jgi:NitT/TauT family transport system ATP-binding protein
VDSASPVVALRPSRDGDAAAIIAVDHVTKQFPTNHPPDGLTVLDDVSFALRAGEVVALLGRSGSGKSTLLRVVAGLLAPSAGEVRYQGRPVNGANPGMAMVFQTFALLPWLTVRQNVELGLEARGVRPADRRRRAEQAIDRIGLDGFESAYPRELSGGMRQRVGFARAIVTEPDALLMDEPFSALDVLTAENLRNELLALWVGPDFPTRAMLLVTHNIEEAVVLADRVLVLAGGRIRAELDVALPRPRDRRSAAFAMLVDQIYGLMTGREERGVRPPMKLPGGGSPTDTPLPSASVGGLAGLLEVLDGLGGREDLPELARTLHFEVDDLLPLVDAAVLLGFANVDDADLELTEAGRRFVEADILASKDVFARHAIDRAPLVRAIRAALEATADGSLHEAFFLDLLHHSLSPEEAGRQVETAIDWGRYGELFDYDAKTGQLILERPAGGEGDARPSS